MHHPFPFPCGINALSLCVISLETNKQKNTSVWRGRERRRRKKEEREERREAEKEWIRENKLCVTMAQKRSPHVLETGTKIFPDEMMWFWDCFKILKSRVSGCGDRRNKIGHEFMTLKLSDECMKVNYSSVFFSTLKIFIRFFFFLVNLQYGPDFIKAFLSFLLTWKDKWDNVHLVLMMFISG